MSTVEARFYTRYDDGRVRCRLCAHGCVMAPGRAGLCGGRRNEGGKLVTEFHGTLIARHVDPIEKKPLFHLLPGSLSYSIATSGCNLRCTFCQNAEISQQVLRVPVTPPEDVVADALRAGCASVAYTYTEPTVFLEYVLDVAVRAHAAGLYNVCVTNGYQSADALAAMVGLVDAANVDLKSFSDGFYRRLCGARLQPVLDTIERMHRSGMRLEVTTLVIPGENDGVAELRALAGFLADLDPAIPWHVSRFHPCHALCDRPVTPRASLQTAVAAGKDAGLQYVYMGNVPGGGGGDTMCPDCGARVIAREGFAVRDVCLRGAACGQCSRPLPMVVERRTPFGA